MWTSNFPNTIYYFPYWVFLAPLSNASSLESAWIYFWALISVLLVCVTVFPAGLTSEPYYQECSWWPAPVPTLPSKTRNKNAFQHPLKTIRKATELQGRECEKVKKKPSILWMQSHWLSNCPPFTEKFHWAVNSKQNSHMLFSFFFFWKHFFFLTTLHMACELT